MESKKTLDQVLYGAEAGGTGDKFFNELFASLGQLTRIANGIPSTDYSYYASIPAAQAALDQSGDGLLELVQRLLDLSSAGELSDTLDLAQIPDLTDEDNFEGLADVCAQILEAADGDLDAAAGVDRAHKQQSVRRGELAVASGARSAVGGSANIQKPQVKLQWNIDNSRNSPFRPRILSTTKSKPHAVVALDRSGIPMAQPLPSSLAAVEQYARESLQVDLDRLESEARNFPHPYEAEINSLSRAQWQLQSSTPQKYAPLKETSCTWVATVESLNHMLAELEVPSCREIAVDLEHHSYRSFQGFLCLMQISSRSADFIVDCIALRDELYVLNSVFADPGKVKVLHGADRDILWLQRDLGLYIVNMFDTYQAARILKYPFKGLAYLLKVHCGVTAQKQYQQADWRIRPLPDEMFKYAREDTHYLLYVYDVIREQLLSRANGSIQLLTQTYQQSDVVCLKTYRKDTFTPQRHVDLIRRLRLHLSPPQKRVFAAVYEWRDRVARAEDESVAYVLPNAMLARVAVSMPTTLNALLSCINPVPELVRRNANEVLQLVVGALETPLETRPRRSNSSFDLGHEGPSVLMPASPVGILPSMPVADSQLDVGVEPERTHGSDMSQEELYASVGWVGMGGWLDPTCVESGLMQDASVHLAASSAEVAALNVGDTASNPLPTSTPIAGPIRATAGKSSKVQLIEASIPPLGHGSAAMDSFGDDCDMKGDSASEQPPAGEDSESDPRAEADRVPRSMSEIYAISIRNRARRETASKALSSVAPDGSVPSSHQASYRSARDAEQGVSTGQFLSAAPPGEAPGDFMQRVGWVKTDAEKDLTSILAETMPGGQGSSVSDSTSANTSGGSHKTRGSRKDSRGKGGNRQARRNTSGNGGATASAPIFDYSAADKYGADRHGGNIEELQAALHARVGNTGRAASSGRGRGRGRGRGSGRSRSGRGGGSNRSSNRRHRGGKSGGRNRSR